MFHNLRTCWLAALFALTAQPSSLHAQPAAPASTPNSQAATNHVLELDGNGSYVELPPNIFNDLTEATVEAWVKWRSDWARIFSYGEYLHDTGIDATGNGTLRFFLQDWREHEKNVTVPGVVKANEWYHIAAVTGKGGMKIYFDGALIATNGYTIDLRIGRRLFTLGHARRASN